MMTPEKKAKMKQVLKAAVGVLKEEHVIERDFVGKIVLNINDGGITAIESMTTVR